MMTTDDLRRAADHCQDLDDPALMAQAWNEPAPRQERSATDSRRELGQLPNLYVPDDFDDPLSDTETAAWEGNYGC
jgi:hypothetical protein